MLDMIRGRFKAFTPVVGKYCSVGYNFYTNANQVFNPLDGLKDGQAFSTGFQGQPLPQGPQNAYGAPSNNHFSDEDYARRLQEEENQQFHSGGNSQRRGTQQKSQNAQFKNPYAQESRPQNPYEQNLQQNSQRKPPQSAANQGHQGPTFQFNDFNVRPNMQGGVAISGQNPGDKEVKLTQEDLKRGYQMGVKANALADKYGIDKKAAAQKGAGAAKSGYQMYNKYA